MSFDGQVLATMKNRVGKGQLVSELNRIEREQKAEMRMHNTAKQRFKAKYYKLEQFLDRSKDAADVRMYETHNPGFCYRRNGECRTPQIQSPSPSVDYNDIYSLLFTDGEVDIEKVLCLHLLTAHKTETLTPPAKNHKPLSMLLKNQSPLERLIERSRKKHQEDSITKLLPTYILDVKTTEAGDRNAKKENGILIRDGRLAARVIINDKIVQLVHIVMEALQHTNPEKMSDLLEMASNVEVIKKVIEKPHIVEFLGTLNGHTLICSCESFHLTQPFKAIIIPLELETTPNSALAELLSHIRKNVLQSPSQDTSKNIHSKSQIIKEESTTHVAVTPRRNKNPKDTSSIGSKSTQAENADVQPSTSKRISNKNRESSISSSTGTSRGSKASSNSKKKVYNKNSVSNKNSTSSSAFPSFLNFLNENKNEREEFTASFKNETSKSSIKKNTKNTEPPVSEATRKVETNIEDVITSDADFFRKLNIRAVANMISNKSLASHECYLGELNEDQESSEDPKKSPKPPLKQTKGYIKQTTCPACIQKWKIPLPNPKTSKIKKVSVPELEQAPYNDFKTGSAQRLSIMIDKEMRKLNSESRRQTPSLSKIPLQRDYKNRGSLGGRQAVDTVDMDALDLAKITQEIKEKETQKKLLKFLSNKV